MPLITLTDYIKDFAKFPHHGRLPWEITTNLGEIITGFMNQLDENFTINDNIAIHKTAIIEPSAVLKGPAIIGAGCFIGNSVLLRGGVFLSDKVTVGSGCEIKTSLIFSAVSIAHFNFIGDSIIGTGVNFEAGAVVANHFNERMNKEIVVTDGVMVYKTGVEKFGALVGDRCKIGANAVLSPGTLLKPDYIVSRLGLIEQK